MFINTAFSQRIEGEPAGSAYLEPFDIFEIGMKLENGESIRYSFSSDTILLFDIHSHDGRKITTYTVMESRTFDGLFVAPTDGDYYFLVENLQSSTVNLHYNISFNRDTHIVHYEDMQFNVEIMSNSKVEVLEFNQENKQILLRMHTPYLTPGFADISVPRSLLDGPYDIQGVTEREYSQDDSVSTFIIKTPNGTHDISITGTTVVPEVPFPIILFALTMISFIVLLKFGKFQGNRKSV